MMIDKDRPFIPANIAVMTVSDTRTFDDDRSGDTLAARVEAAGHNLADRVIVRDEFDAITSQLYAWMDDKGVDVIISTGGTGITGRDITPECFEALYTKAIPGFGELFRMLSYDTIGTSTIQSRATGGIAGTTLMFALPGSTGAVKDGWDKILSTQLDNRYRPCNFIELMPRFGEK
ncbi:molybdenum cofactor biosynthesis protein B [Kordiimonas sp.]|uniref:molybdenum cofactor biosynthesis protein B n=1 Tax=Kordiimonas sp. TaxID=1970157 RepID=UPI003A91BAC2